MAAELNPLLYFCFAMFGVFAGFLGFFRRNRTAIASLALGILLVIGTMFVVLFRGSNLTDEIYNSAVSLLVLGMLVTLGIPFFSLATRRRRR
jgi:peptidoglycan/LPS O-acetylase OafA/YrhL